jgi:hypothetical protein
MSANEIVNAKLTGDESKLATGIGAALANDLSKQIDGIEKGMQALYTPTVKAVNGRQLNMVKAILAACKAALEDAGKPVGTVAQIATVIMWHVKSGLDLPKLYKDARIAYSEKPKAKREPRTPNGEGKESHGEAEALQTIKGAAAEKGERGMLLSGIVRDLQQLGEDALLDVALFVAERLKAQRADEQEAIDAADDEAEAAAA